MNFQDIIFYIFSAVLIVSALGVITVRNPVYFALLLVVAFVSCAGLWLLLEAEFLAIALVLVYVGAVMVLFLFVVMMLDINLDQLREGFWKWFPFGALIALILACARCVQPASPSAALLFRGAAAALIALGALDALAAFNHRTLLQPWFGRVMVAATIAASFTLLAALVEEDA